MLAACKQCSFQITVATMQAADYFSCPVCGGRLALASVTDAASPPKSEAIQSNAPIAPGKSAGGIDATTGEFSISLERLQEVDKWRAVARGLRLVYAAWWVPLGCFAGLIVISPIAIAVFGRSEPAPIVGLLIGAVLVISFVTTELIQFVGLIQCCQLPANSGGRAGARFATGLLGIRWLVLGIMFLLLVIDEHRFATITLLLLVMSLLYHMIGVISWLYSIRAFAVYFGNYGLAKNSLMCIFAIAFWASTLPFAAFIRDNGPRQVPTALMIFLMWNTAWVAVFYLGLMRIVNCARRTVEIVLQVGLAPGEVQRLQLRRRMEMVSSS